MDHPRSETAWRSTEYPVAEPSPSILLTQPLRKRCAWKLGWLLSRCLGFCRATCSPARSKESPLLEPLP